jgi:hypothetical protein
MWNPFRKKRLLSEEDAQFQIACYKWLLTHFGGDNFYEETRLILPTKEFFPSVADSDASAAKITFEQVKKYAGMWNWPVSLQLQEHDPDLQVAPTLVIQNVEQSPLGAFMMNENNEVTITYNPKLSVDPTQMVTTFAHELSHYLTGTAAEPPPGGWDNWEFATDIAATFLGFGIFQANAAFNFDQHANVDSIGGQTSGGGYLTEAEHSYSLAIFLRLKGIEPEFAFPHCDSNVKGHLKRALTELDASSIVDELRKTTCTNWFGCN